MAIFLVDLILLRVIKITTKSGTLRNIPAIPQNLPKIVKKIIITRGLILSVFPISFGSKIFPT